MKSRLLLIGILLGAVTVPASALTIDAFNSAQGPLNGAGTFNAVSSSGILGGERDVLLSFFPATSGFAVTSGGLALSQTSGFTDIVVTYDGADNSPALSMGLGSLNLLRTGTAFQIDLLPTSASDPHAHLWLRAYTSASSYSEVHLVLEAGNFPSTLNIPFDTMAPFGTGADFSNVNAIEMELAIGSGIHMEMNLRSLAVVPESSQSLLPLAIGTSACFVGSIIRKTPVTCLDCGQLD